MHGPVDLVPAGTVGRSLCEIHNANWPFQLQGCVAAGQQVTDIVPNGRAVTASVMTFGALMGKIGPEKQLTVTIR